QTQVAGLQPAIGREGFGGLFWLLPVSFADMRASYLQLTNLAVGQQLAALGIDDAHFNAGQGPAYGTDAPLAPQRVREVHARFRHTVTLQQGVAKGLLESEKDVVRQAVRA